MLDITFIVACYNGASKMRRCLSSLDEFSKLNSETKVIFVDDHSSDKTFSLLSDYCHLRSWATVLQLEANSGSPSRPRNTGIRKAESEYVYFLDIDDELRVEGLLEAAKVALESDADVVRCPLIRDDGENQRQLNTLDSWDHELSRIEKLKLFITKQSTTVCGIIKRSLLIKHEILWPEDIRMGEDTIFWAKVFSAAVTLGYSPQPDFIYHVERIQGQASSTQTYGSRELQNHLKVWRQVQEILMAEGISYLEIRGQVATQTALGALIRHNLEGVPEDDFNSLADFFCSNSAIISKFSYNQRLAEIRESILARDYSAFSELIKLRLLIAGCDLKFVLAAVPRLKKHFQVQVDEWKGHEVHDEQRSLRMLKWAEVIHCEWLLGNAVWYSERKMKHQKLIVRTHLFEISRDYGHQVKVDAIDRFIAVSLPTLEDMQRKFEFPRERVRLIPNFVDVERYERSDDESKVFNLAIIGILPARKGFHRALELLRQLHQIDSRYNLTIYGKVMRELAWVANDPVENHYYEQCENYIRRHGLESAVHYSGWVDTKEALADKGFVLSVSDFESFHVAPAEAFAAGNIALFLPWRGVEFIYPEKYVHRTIEEMRSLILSLKAAERFDEFAAPGVKFVSENYSLDNFETSYVEMVSSIA